MIPTRDEMRGKDDEEIGAGDMLTLERETEKERGRAEVAGETQGGGTSILPVVGRGLRAELG